MESRHLLKNVNVSLRKLRMFLPEIKKMSPSQARETLTFMPHSAAKVLGGAIKTAIANAESTLKVPESMLEFRCLKADQGLVIKRFRAGSRGTARPINRRMSHITIILGVKKSKSAPQIEKDTKAEILDSNKKNAKVEPKETTETKVSVEKKARAKRAPKAIESSKEVK